MKMTIRKTCMIISVFIIILIFFATLSYGFSVNELTGTQDQQAVVRLKDMGNGFVEIISTNGVIISVIVLIILGIKYMIGSVDERAEYKKTLLPYVIGAGLVFAASSIAQIVYNIAINL